jgi:flagellar basal-body rod modification protein FlgD
MATVQAANSSSDLFATLNAQGKAAAAGSGSTSEEVQNRFLKLLTTQLKNQDPLNPMDNAAITSQISQISTVTGIERLNASLETLLGSYHDGQAMQAAGLIGKSVLAPGSSLALVNGAANGGVTLAGAADSVTLTILDAAGKVVQSQSLGAREAGNFGFAWDGQTDAGTLAPPGTYHFAVNALRGNEKVAAETLQIGTVSALVRDKGSFQLELGGLGRVGFDKVQEIFQEP